MKNIIIITTYAINDDNSLFNNTHSQLIKFSNNVKLNEYWNSLNLENKIDGLSEYLSFYNIKETNIWGYKCHHVNHPPEDRIKYFNLLMSNINVDQDDQIWLIIHDKEIYMNGNDFLSENDEFVLGLKNSLNLKKSPIVYYFQHVFTNNIFVDVIKNFPWSKYINSTHNIENYVLQIVARKDVVKKLYEFKEDILIKYYPSFWKKEIINLSEMEINDCNRLLREIWNYWNTEDIILKIAADIRDHILNSIDLTKFRDLFDILLIESKCNVYK